jgi:ketosteroid isomerase-like protein
VEDGMSAPAGNLELARSYLQSIERGGTLEPFFASEVEFVIYPNSLVPQVNRHNLAGALDGAERGRKIMARQKYLITDELVEGDRVALEVEWTGTLALPFGGLPAGGQMKAYFAMFLEFREGKIVAQRNYDCFERW